MKIITEQKVCYGFDPSASRDVGKAFMKECSKTLVNGSSPGWYCGVIQIKETNEKPNTNCFDWYSFGGFRESKVSGTVSTGFDRLRGGTTLIAEEKDEHD